jgi:prepilin-type N-terminal cleavage/methylation domain-containing protein
MAMARREAAVTKERAGFTLVEVLAVLAILMVVAAAVVPALIGGLDRSRINETASSLAGIGGAVDLMYRDTGRYPGQLSHLTTPITTGQQHLCGGNYTAAEVANWAGPYLNRQLPATGLPLPIGVAQNAVVLMTPPPGTHLGVVVNGVSEEDAVALNRKVDADGSAAAGAVRWTTPPVDGVVTVTYVIPVRAC